MPANLPSLLSLGWLAEHAAASWGKGHWNAFQGSICPLSLSTCGSRCHSRVPALKSGQIDFCLLLLVVRNGTYILVALKIPDGHCEDQEKSDVYAIFSDHILIFQPAGFSTKSILIYLWPKKLWGQSKWLTERGFKDTSGDPWLSSESSGPRVAVAGISEPLSHTISTSTQSTALHGLLGLKPKAEASFRKWAMESNSQHTKQTNK